MEKQNEEAVTPEEITEELEVEETEAEEVTSEEQEKIDWKARALKAEATILKQKAKAKEKEETPKEQSSSLTREEAILFAKGLSDEEVEKAKKVAALEDISLTEAVNNDIFVSWKKAQEARRKAEEASLGASKGSARTKPQKDFKTSGLTEEEHRQLWQQATGR